jgi:glycosyltransferase involved in cell wall biosynthesis
MGEPRVAAIVTCFNLGAHLREAVDSIRAQTLHDVEICVVDDGSTDAATRRALAALPDAVRVVRTANSGLPAARNTGVAATRAPYICAVDADDVLLPELFEKSVAALEADPSVAFVSHWLEAFGDQSWSWTPASCDLPGLLAANTVNGAAIVRRTVLEKVGGWDTAMRNGLEDWDLWITIVERGFRGIVLPEVLFRYRRRPDSMSRLSFAAGGHSRIYRHLVEKHAETFATHLPDLIAARESEIAALRRRAEDLDRRLEAELRPADLRARADLEEARRCRAAWDQRERAHAERAALEAHATALEAHAAALTQQVETGRREILALRESWSWRVTRPMRAAGALVRPDHRR